MTKPIALAFAALLALPVYAQQTGVANPPDDSVMDLPPAATAAPAVKAAPPAVQQPAAHTEVYGEYKPYNPTNTLLKARMPETDPDAGVVTDVPRRAGELPIGTQLRARLATDVDTASTQPETRFTASVIDDLASDGRVVVPAGSTVEGRITEVRGGKRIHGAAMIHLQIDDVLLPDGTRLPMRAQVIDTDQFADTRIDTEGNILRKDHVGATLTAMSLTTGGAAAAGGVIAGPAGALIGAGVGAGLGTVVWLKQDRQARLPQGTQMVLSLTEALDLTRTDFAGKPVLQQRVPTASNADISATSAPLKPSAAKPYVEPQAFVPTN